MITLIDDQDVPGFPQFAVITGGTYQEEDTVPVYTKGDSTKSASAQFQAQFISIGEKVYQ